MRSFAWLWAVIAVLCVEGAAQDPAVLPLVLTPSTVVSTDGTLDLSWSGGAADAASFELEEVMEGGDGVPNLLDAGPHRASARSGLADGTYTYRVRAVVAGGGPGPWSDPITVTVQHHALGLAFAFFGVGAFVFLATVALIVIGHRRAARGED